MTQLWLLTESSSFKQEIDGIEDIEHSISELDIMQNYDKGKNQKLLSPSKRRQKERKERANKKLRKHLP